MNNTPSFHRKLIHLVALEAFTVYDLAPGVFDAKGLQVVRDDRIVMV
jgi:hypothetical protein